MQLLPVGRLRAIPMVLCVLLLCAFATAGWTAPSNGTPETLGLADLSLIDAVRSALAQQPDIFIAREAASYRKGVYTETGGEFDLTGEALLGIDQNRAALGTTAAGRWTVMDKEEDLVNGSVGLSRKLRTGQTLSLQASASRTDKTIAGIPQTGPDNIGQVFFTIVQPLGKGRGREGTDANEESARRQSEAALQELLHVVSSRAADAARAYWSYLSMIRQVKTLVDAEERSRSLTEQVATLIAHEELPAVEITQARANLADARTARLRGEQALFDSRQQLLLSMGIDGRYLSAAVGCRDDFPSLPDGEALRSLDPRVLVQMAMNLRADYRAMEWTESARDVFLKGVERNMAPQVDLKLKAGYVGYQDGPGVDDFRRSFEENVPGASVSMQIVASWPFSNSSMRGRLMQARSHLEQARWEKEKLDRQIRSDLMKAWSQLKNKMAVLEEARLAQRNYDTSLASEKRKYLLGMSTLMDVLNVENKLTQAQLNVVMAQTEVASSLVTLRHESGTLLTQEGEWTGVRAEDLVTLPPAGKKALENRPPGKIPPGKGPHSW